MLRNKKVAIKAESVNAIALLLVISIRNYNENEMVLTARSNKKIAMSHEQHRKSRIKVMIK